MGMIKFVELTAPEVSEFRQAKILSIEVSEGDQIKIGDTLFRVKSGESEFDLPTTKAGIVSEIIVIKDENITIMTPLLLLETEVEESTATTPIIDPVDSKSANSETKANTKKARKKAKKKARKKSKRNTKRTGKKKTARAR